MRRFVLSAWLSYRALFTWLNPIGYVSSRLIAPVFLTLMFTLLGGGGEATARSLAGGACLAVLSAGIFGVTLSIAGERNFGTLGLWMCSPQGILPGLLGKSFVYLFDGILSAVLTFGATAPWFDFGFSADAVPALILLLVVSGVSGIGAGMLAGSVAVRFRDVFATPNIIHNAVMAFSGALVATHLMPVPVAGLDVLLPLHSAVPAALRILEGDGMPWVLLGQELLRGVLWGLTGWGLLLMMRSRARSKGNWDAM